MINILVKYTAGLMFASFFLGLFGCASTSQKTVLEVKSLVRERQFEKALAIIESDNFYPEERSKLLKLLEDGTVRYFAGHYYQASKLFYEAQELSNKLYTVSISKKALTGLANDSADNYYGELYERSLIRFYFSLSNFMLYQTATYEAHSEKIAGPDGKLIEGKLIPEKKLSEGERRVHLFAAKAAIVEWDSLLENYKSEHAGKSAYKVDLTAKIYGAFIHEQFNSNTDNQIALQLYKDAKEVLFKNYNTYGTFNSSEEAFRENFSKFPTMERAEVEKNFVRPTIHAKDLLDFIDGRIARLSSKEQNAEVAVLIQNDSLTDKSESEVKLPIDLGVNMGADAKSFGQFVSMVFSSGRGGILDIAFKLPNVAKKITTERMELVAKEKSGKEYKVALAIVNPLSDLAYEAFKNSIGAITAKTTARIAAKYVAALMIAYNTYKHDQAAGLGAGILARMSINASEGADLRYWSTLPHDLRFAIMDLPPGEYEFFVNHISNQNKISTTLLGKQSINERKSDLFIPAKVN
ncbi:MAG: hypothetical protein A2504_02995 [Bdellovibrionales bacterium RIFOXYD12_FULL_39_22]|nr:MAG: hypothetical protein A2385_05710 [Bdellovibrionales bacterium RIFOXYB1_FULL_39_21]OFZ42249.1 MAG: hypothetical protein A2485_15740 [Bdellovibrionales bacterium RIFOXYC12_FULL_39_17]OFZ46659.1 MAG: hypothetical protein A2404_03930 [Bdellovibrionales bacterium RIFOXYC1_FULL_39_130]OFZ76064.1 MAG: hypothetical protein A2560_03220 [Bdellovibrionales bacterium RIFOXYD1_FULL_39_84]OFZ93048.1 MAG: hypothetical protein A2504_02995 [Bdellovibrionales bacterium RIFOXYD12_FULL_39_22]HLE09942.1 hy